MHYYQFNIGDYIANTARLSNLEDLCYRRLLDLYYLNEQPFNECSNSVAREVGFVEQIEIVEFILNKYFTLIDGFWHQNRADREISLYQKKLDSASKAGKASAKARQLKASERTFNDRSQSVEPNIKHKTLNNKHKTIKDKTIELPESIDSIAWGEWVQHRKELRKKLTKSQITKQLKFLCEQSDPNAVINQSIKNGWAGLFELKNQSNFSSNQPYSNDFMKQEFK